MPALCAPPPSMLPVSLRLSARWGGRVAEWGRLASAASTAAPGWACTTQLLRPLLPARAGPHPAAPAPPPPQPPRACCQPRCAAPPPAAPQPLASAWLNLRSWPGTAWSHAPSRRAAAAATRHPRARVRVRGPAGAQRLACSTFPELPRSLISAPLPCHHRPGARDGRQADPHAGKAGPWWTGLRHRRPGQRRRREHARGHGRRPPRLRCRPHRSGG